MKNLYFSRKMNLFGIITLLLLGSGFSLSAQQIITEHISGNLNATIKYQPNIDESSYAKVLDANGNTVFLKNQAPIENTPQSENTENDVSLNVDFNYDDSQYYISLVMIYDQSGYMYTADYSSVTNPLVLSVPDGTYDIMTEFKPLNSGKSHIIIKEQQSVEGNTTVQMNPTAAVNFVTTTGYDENGQNFQSTMGGYFSFNRSLYFNPGDFVTIADYYFTIPEPGQDPEWNFYINDVSDRYSVIQTLIGAGFEQGDYFTKFETITGIDESVSIANDPADWSYHTEVFQATQLSDNEFAPAYFLASTFNDNLIVGWSLSAGGTISPGNEPFRAYLNNPLDGDPADLLVIPSVIDHYVSYSPTTGGIAYFTKGNPVFSDGNGGVLYASGDVSFNSHTAASLGAFPSLADDYYLADNSKYKLLPFHPRFAFNNATTPSVILGDNVPITVTGFKLRPNGANTFKIANKGRYGETRESDYLATQMEVKQNGNGVFSGNYADFQFSNLPASGQIEIVLTNANTVVEGLEGINTTTITYNADEEDAPPTLQHLQFRNSDNEVTPIFDSSLGANVRLAAGDFNYAMIDEASGTYAYEEGNHVELSYSIYDQNEWTDLELTEYPEYFQMPAFGNYYEASLEGIANDELWYDVKVICTDAAGNIQQQVISPAFKINGTLGTKDLVESDFIVYPNPFSEQLNVILPENIKGDYTFKVIDLTGRTVYTKIQNEISFTWDSSDLSKGVYMLSIENNGTAIAKKVIKL